MNAPNAQLHIWLKKKVKFLFCIAAPGICTYHPQMHTLTHSQISRDRKRDSKRNGERPRPRETFLLSPAGCFLRAEMSWADVSTDGLGSL